MAIVYYGKDTETGEIVSEVTEKDVETYSKINGATSFVKKHKKGIKIAGLCLAGAAAVGIGLKVASNQSKRRAAIAADAVDQFDQYYTLDDDSYSVTDDNDISNL